MIEVDTKTVVPAVRAAGDQTAERMRQVHGPYWSSRLDVCKSVLTITSAVLVGTISFSSSLLGPGKQTLSWPCFLYSTWLLFVISICAGIYALWNLYQLNTFHATFNNKSPELEAALNAIGPRVTPEELTAEIDKVVGKITNESAKPLHAADKSSHNGLKTQLITFGIGICLFFIFGVLQVV